MKILIAIDSFKGCITSAQAAQAAAQGVADAFPDAQVTCLPVSDGGEGMLEAFQAVTGGQEIIVPAHDPLMRPITASYGLTGDGTAIIEMAQASGLALLQATERNPLQATSYGTGELIADALRRGCKRMIVGLGGSATVDGGRGMLEALGATIGDDVVDLSQSLLAECDVPITIAGWAAITAQAVCHDYRDMPGAGAAGGVGFALLAYMHATMQSGIDLLMDLIDIDHMLDGCDLVITGEGSADRQTLMGKLPSGILRRAHSHGVPTILIAGRVSDHQSLLDAGFAQVHCVNPAGSPLSECMQPDIARHRLAQWGRRFVNEFRINSF